MAQLIAIVLMVVAGWGFVAAHDAKQRSLGAANERAAQAKREAAQAAADARLDKLGREAAEELADARKRRLKINEQELANELLANRILSDQLAAKDPEYADWRGRDLPVAVADRVRNRAARVPAAKGGDVPRSGVRPGGSAGTDRARD